MAVIQHQLPIAAQSGISALVRAVRSLLMYVRRLAIVMMVLAAASLAPAAVAGAYEAGLDAAQIAMSVSGVDADECLSKTDAKGQKTPMPDGEHCIACCLHHHGPSGLSGDGETLAAHLPSHHSWVEWQPTGLVQAPEPVLIQPPRA